MCNYILIILLFHWCKADSSHQCLKALTGSKEILFALLLSLGHFPYLALNNYFLMYFFQLECEPEIILSFFGSEHLLSLVEFSLMQTAYSIREIKSEPRTKSYPA